jgi:hypothetical protein
MTKKVMRDPIPPLPLQVPGGIALKDSKKAVVMADTLEVQFRLAKEPSEAAVIEMVKETMCTHEYAPASEAKLTRTSEVLQAIE